MTFKKIYRLAILAVLLAMFGCSGKPNGPDPAETVGPTPNPLPTKVLRQSYMQWEKPPRTIIDPKKHYVITIQSEKGDVKIRLFADKAPKSVNNIIFLIKQGFYKNLSFHRVVPGFVAQLGKPPVETLLGPGYNIKAEINPDLGFDVPGVVAMAITDNIRDTIGSQFFITYKKLPWLYGDYTIVGRILEGMDVLESLTPVDDYVNWEYGGDVIDDILVEEADASTLPPIAPTAEPKAPILVEGRPLANIPWKEREYIFGKKPAFVIDKTKIYKAAIKTGKGTIEVDLFPADAPESVNNFFVIANLGYYDNSPVSHKLRARYMLMGSPFSKGDSDIGYPIPQEKKREIKRGVMGYYISARRDGTSSGSNVFIMLTNDPRVSGVTMFGEVTKGLDVVEKITTEDVIEKVDVSPK